MYINSSSLNISNIPVLNFIVNYLYGLVYPYEIFKTLMDIVTGNANIYQELWFIVEIAVLTHFLIKYSKAIEEKREKSGVTFFDAIHMLFSTQLSDKLFLFISIWSYIMSFAMALTGSVTFLIMTFNLGLGTLTMGLLYAVVDFASIKLGSLSKFALTHTVLDEYVGMIEEGVLGLVFYTVAGVMLLAFGYRNTYLLILGSVFLGVSLPFLILAGREMGRYYALTSDLSVVYAHIKQYAAELLKEHPEMKEVIMLHEYIAEARIAYDGYFALYKSISGIKRGEKVLKTIGIKNFYVSYDKKNKEIHVGVPGLIDLTTKKPSELKNKVDEVIAFLEKLIAEKTGKPYEPIDGLDNEKIYFVTVLLTLRQEEEEKEKKEKEGIIPGLASEEGVAEGISEDETGSVPESDEQSYSGLAYDRGIGGANRGVGYVPEEEGERPAYYDEEEEEKKKRAVRKRASDRRNGFESNYN